MTAPEGLSARETAIRSRHVMRETWDRGNPEADADHYVRWCDGCGQRPWPRDSAYLLALRAATLPESTVPAAGLRNAVVAEDVELNRFGEPLCARCHHGHTEAAWSDRDADDGTCWNAGSLVCGCPKFITPSVKRYRSTFAAATPPASPSETETA